MNNFSAGKGAFLTVLVIIFCIQTYYMLTSVIPGYSEPFIENEKLFEFVNSGFLKVWSMTLFWPAVFMATLAAEIFFNKKGD